MADNVPNATKNSDSGSAASILSLIGSIMTIIQVLIWGGLLWWNNGIDNVTLTVYQAGILVCIVTLAILQRKIVKDNSNQNHKITESAVEIARLKQENEQLKAGHVRKVQELQAECDRKKILLEKIAEHNHNINHQHRQIEHKIYKVLYRGFDNPRLTQEKYQQRFFKFLQYFTLEVRETFNLLTDDNCAVYISALVIRKDPVSPYFVHTFYRDPSSYQARCKISDDKKPVYNVTEFTPFKKIMDESIGESIFSSDDCSGYSDFSDRIHDWHKYYNACLCVPIQLTLKERQDKNTKQVCHQLIGFLTVDNKKGNLANDIARELLCSYADILFTVWNMYIDLSAMLEAMIEVEQTAARQEKEKKQKTKIPVDAEA